MYSQEKKIKLKLSNKSKEIRFKTSTGRTVREWTRKMLFNGKDKAKPNATTSIQSDYHPNLR